MPEASHHIPFSSFISSAEILKKPIVIYENERILGKDLKRDVLKLLSIIKQKPGKRWGIYFDECYPFLVTILALFHAGKIPVLLPNIQSDFLQAIQSEMMMSRSD